MSGLVKFAAGAIAALAISGGAAQASTWVIDYTANSVGETPYSAVLDIKASDSLDNDTPAPGYDVLKVTGEVDGDTITGLVLNPNQPSVSTSPDGLFFYDNVVWPGAVEELSNPGILFTGASGAEYNLFSDTPANANDPVTYELYKAVGGGYDGNSQGTISMVETFQTDQTALSGGVPEPAAWMMMILGFGGVGALLRRRRHGAAFTPA
jgi:hypothetical protein